MTLTPQLTNEAHVVKYQPRDRAEEVAMAFLAGYSGRTFDAYRYDLSCWFRWVRLQGVEVLEVKRAHLEMWMRDMEQNGFDRGPLQASTIDRRLSTIAGFYKYAHIDGVIAANPAAYVRRPRIHDKVRPDIDSADIRRFLAVAERAGGARHVLAFLLTHNGLRVSEACSLNVEDLGSNRGHRTVSFVGKGNKPALVPIAPPLARAIDLLVGTRATGPILTRKDGHRLDRRTAYGWIRAIGKKADMPMGVHPHLLRAAYISEALAAGVPLADVQLDARHADPRTTMRYDRRARNMDRHSTYLVSARLTGG